MFLLKQLWSWYSLDASIKKFVFYQAVNQTTKLTSKAIKPIFYSQYFIVYV